MATDKISISKAKARLGELVKRVAYGDERIVLEFRNRPQAAIVSYSDLQRLEAAVDNTSQRKKALEKLRILREQIAARNAPEMDAVTDIREARDERLERL